jgi:hypothetical protein
MTAAMVSRTALPFSHVSATAIFSRFASMMSAIFRSMLERSVTEDLFQVTAALCAASRAFSTSSAFPRATSQNVFPFTGDAFSKYWPDDGFTYWPPIQWS